jgi:hypothetical protein
LAVLERNVGDKDLADSCFLKARYWQLQHLELSNVGSRRAYQTVRLFDIQKWTRWVEDRDQILLEGGTVNYNVK